MTRLKDLNDNDIESIYEVRKEAIRVKTAKDYKVRAEVILGRYNLIREIKIEKASIEEILFFKDIRNIMNLVNEIVDTEPELGNFEGTVKTLDLWEDLKVKIGQQGMYHSINNFVKLGLK